ncbi:MAG: putative toxin-antitoxin system toxin component, PIN family [Gemmatimonadetes bacterium]|nr:putative toxin-antitoxin system toxin component, PIN family [Gemmatimonadota bacterium]
MTPRVVLDSNVVVSALLFPQGRLTWIRHTWMRRDYVPLVSAATSKELIRVLAYPKFGLAPEAIEALLSDYLPFAETVRFVPGEAFVPETPDPDDRIFMELAVAGEASLLVTGDRALRQVPGPSGLRVVSPEEFRAELGDSAGLPSE